jgi:hypothetical protein
MAKRKRRRQGHPARVSPLRVLESADAGVPLEGRPEYEAHMAAWRKHGCPRPSGGPQLS